MQQEGAFPKRDIARFLTMLGFDVDKLRILTSLTTYRVDVSYEGGLLSIDQNEYSGELDYEVEFEYSNLEGAQKILRDLLEKNDIPCSFSASTKTRRAMKAIAGKTSMRSGRSASPSERRRRFPRHCSRPGSCDRRR